MAYSFENSVKKGTLHHAFIIEGSHSVDKVAYTKNIVKQILCKEDVGVGCNKCTTCRKIDDDNYIDMYIVEKTQEKGSKTKSVKDKQIAALQDRLNRSPFEGNRNIAIISDADTMNVKAFNRLLKTIEEPPEGTVIFLLSENIKNLPQTIKSRCIHIRINEAQVAYDMVKGRDKAEELIMLILDGDYFYKEKQLLESYVKDREKAYVLLDAMEVVYREILFGNHDEFRRFTKEYIFRAVKAIEEARGEIQSNVSVQYALRKMILNIGG